METTKVVTGNAMNFERGKSMRNKAGSFLSVETLRTIWVPGDWGDAGNVYVGKEEAARWRANPDLFCAEHLGFGDDVRAYLEWLDCSALPKCAGLTKSGAPCNGSTIYYAERDSGPVRLDAQDWKLAHRRFFCRKHGGNMEAQVVDGRSRNNSGLDWHDLLADPAPRPRPHLVASR